MAMSPLTSYTTQSRLKGLKTVYDSEIRSDMKMVLLGLGNSDFLVTSSTPHF